MSIKTIDPAYEGYAGIPRQRSAYTGGVWQTCTCIDIGRAKSVSPVQEEADEQERFKPPRQRKLGPKATKIRDYLLKHGPSRLNEIAEALELGKDSAREVIRDNKDFFVLVQPGGSRRLGESGVWNVKRI